ncbi:MAG: preprotein translocase subunit YajC [Clostridiales bacterium]|nr:preprotein translocase subunit YajC [Clostridiales bacterium]
MFEKLFGIAAAVAEEAAAAGAAAESEAPQQVSSIAALATTFLPLILIFVVFWFMLIRPQRKKDKQVKEMLNNLKAGDRICTIGGIYGTITGLKDDTITLSVGKDNMSMVVARWAIRSVEELTIENDAQELN